jgi:hypothetical protein
MKKSGRSHLGRGNHLPSREGSLPPRWLAPLALLLLAHSLAFSEDITEVGGTFYVDEAYPPDVAESPRTVWGGGPDFATVWLDDTDLENVDPSIQGFTNPRIRVFALDGTNASIPEPLNFRIGQEETRWPDVSPSSSGYIASFADDSNNDPGLFDVYVVTTDVDGLVVVEQDVPFNSLFEGVGILNPRIGGDGSNRFLVAWSDDRFVAGLRDIFGIRVDNAAVTLDSADFMISTPFEDTTARTPDVAANDAGDHVVVWADNQVLVETGGGAFEPRFDVYARRIPAGINPAVDPLPPLQAASATNELTLTDASNPAVAFGDGFFVVAWEEDGAVRARPLDSQGIPLEDEFFVTDPPGASFNAVSPSVTHFGNGRFAITWRDDGDGGSIRIRMYNPRRHVFLSPDLPLLTQVPADASPDSAVTLSGRYLVVWQEVVETQNILGQLFDITKPGDLTNDSILDALDLYALSLGWNPEAVQGVENTGDINGDGNTDQQDLLDFMLLVNQDRMLPRIPPASAVTKTPLKAAGTLKIRAPRTPSAKPARPSRRAGYPAGRRNAAR